MTSDTAHAITVTAGAAANTTTAGEILARVVVNGANTATSLRVVGSSAATEIVTATYNAANSRMEVATNTSATAGAAGTALNGLGGAASDALTVSAATSLNSAGVTGYTVTDTYTNIDGAAAAVISNAGANAVTATVTTAMAAGDVSGYTTTGVDKIDLAAAGVTTQMNATQYGLINAATGTDQVTIDTIATGVAINSAIETTVLGAFANTVSVASGFAGTVTATAAAIHTITINGTLGAATLTGAGGNDVISMAAGSNAAAVDLNANFVDLTIASGGSVTLNIADDLDQFSGTITAGGVETVTVDGGAGTFKALTNVEKYVLDAAAAVVVAIGSVGVTHVTGTATAAEGITGMTSTLDNAAGAAFNLGGGDNDAITYAATQTVEPNFSAFSGVEIVDVGVLGVEAGDGTHTMALVDGIHTFKLSTATEEAVLQGTVAQLNALNSIVHTDGTETFGLTATDAGSLVITNAGLAISGTGGNIDALTLDATGPNTVTIDAANIAKIVAVTAASAADTLVVIDDATVSSAFDAFEVITANGTDVDLTDTNAVARTINGDAGDNVITLNGVASAKTVDLSSGGTDTVTVSMDATATTTVRGFTSGDDVFNVITAADGATNVTFNVVSTTGFTATSAATDASQGIVLVGSSFQISGALTATGDAGAVEAAIIAAGLVGINTTNDDNEFLMFAIDNGTDTGIYRVQIAAGADTGFNAADDMDNITLVGILEGVTTDGLVAADII
jgi:hypothetical protein